MEQLAAATRHSAPSLDTGHSDTGLKLLLMWPRRHPQLDASYEQLLPRLLPLEHYDDGQPSANRACDQPPRLEPAQRSLHSEQNRWVLPLLMGRRINRDFKNNHLTLAETEKRLVLKRNSTIFWILNVQQLPKLNDELKMWLLWRNCVCRSRVKEKCEME